MAKKKRRVRAAGSITHGVRYTRTAGIDTDKDMLVTAFYDVNAPSTQIDEFPQSNTGIAALIQKLKARDIQAVIIESTGQYHMNAYNRMAAAGLHVLVVNPLAIKALLRVEGTLPHYQIVLTREHDLDMMEVRIEVTSEVFSDTISALMSSIITVLLSLRSRE